jgi:cytoskeletal protein RodZ
VTSWLKAKLGRARVSTLVLIVAFLALFWVYHNVEPQPAATQEPTPAVVPPGFIPDPNYTWVPRTNVRRPKEPEYTTTTTQTTTSPTETTTTSPGEITTSPTSPTETPTPDVVDPDGPGPLAPLTITPPTLPTIPGLAPPPTTTAPPG